MPLLSRKKLLLAKTEVSYGTDPTPTGAANAILTSDLSINPLAGSSVSRNFDRAAFGNSLNIKTATFVEISFMVEIAGSGDADTPPAYGPLLLACGFSQTINAATSVVYAPISAAIGSITLYFHHDGQLHEVNGARGTVSLNLDAGGIPKYAFTFTGLYVAPTSTADATPTLSGFMTPLAVTNTNTPTFSLHSTDVVMNACSIDIGNSVIHRDVVNSERVDIVDRAVAGSVSFEAPAISDKNWFAISKAGTTGALSIVHGTAAGGIVTIAGPSVQLINPTYADFNGVSVIQTQLLFAPTSAGNNEITITTT
jgi:hypothetical protein